jgi:hypothetical protein
MSSYLETYGASEEHRVQRIRLVRNSAIILFAVLIAGGILYGVFKNYSEEQQVKNFVALTRSQDYRGAYALWGCTDAHPCPEYSFAKFMDDWGPKSAHADESSARIGLSQSCGSGVVIRLDYAGSEEPVTLSVERGTKVVGFAPWEECPGTKHLRIGAWLRSLFNH